jgi:hypothetical protein
MAPQSTDEELEWVRAHGGYAVVRRLPDGSIAGLMPLLTTLAICLGVTRTCAYERRFCFRDRELAAIRYTELQSEDDTPEGWHARRPEQPCDWQAKQRPGYLGGDPALPSSWERNA